MRQPCKAKANYIGTFKGIVFGREQQGLQFACGQKAEFPHGEHKLSLYLNGR
jgi:hypothetical protein